MSAQVLATPSSKKISDLYRRVKDGSLILNPEFQRKFVWNIVHRENFIETILKGLPFPEIYLAQQGVDLDRLAAEEVVVDGQQRLSTIIRYIDEPEGSNEFGKIVPKFRTLSKEEQRNFLNYNVVVRDLGDVDSELIKEIFRRINLTKYNLRQVEIHNAIYDGTFIQLAKDLTEQSLVAQLPTFGDAGLLRMDDLDFVLLVITTIENGGYFNYSNEVEKYIAQNNDEYANKTRISETFIRIIKLIKSLKLERDSIWYRKSNLLTLTVELMKAHYIPKNLKDRLMYFESKILENKTKENEFGLYYAAMYTGTNKRKERVVRGEIFRKNVLDQR